MYVYPARSKCCNGSGLVETIILGTGTCLLTEVMIKFIVVFEPMIDLESIIPKSGVPA